MYSTIPVLSRITDGRGPTGVHGYGAMDLSPESAYRSSMLGAFDFGQLESDINEAVDPNADLIGPGGDFETQYEPPPTMWQQISGWLSSDTVFVGVPNVVFAAGGLAVLLMGKHRR